MLGLCLLSLALGVAGFFLIGWFVGTFFLYGFELSRPASRNPRRDAALTIAERALLLAFIPTVIVVLVVERLSPAGVALGEVDLPWHYQLLIASAWTTVIGSVLSAWAILRARGPTSAIRFHVRTLPLCVVGALLVMILPPGPVWMLAPIVLFAPIAMFFGHAIWRVFVPVERVAHVAEPAPIPVAPVFTPFRGGRT